jgi:hypothetical protein
MSPPPPEDVKPTITASSTICPKIISLSNPSQQKVTLTITLCLQSQDPITVVAFSNFLDTADGDAYWSSYVITDATSSDCIVPEVRVWGATTPSCNNLIDADKELLTLYPGVPLERTIPLSPYERLPRHGGQPTLCCVELADLKPGRKYRVGFYKDIWWWEEGTKEDVCARDYTGGRDGLAARGESLLMNDCMDSMYRPWKWPNSWSRLRFVWQSPGSNTLWLCHPISVNEGPL